MWLSDPVLWLGMMVIACGMYVIGFLVGRGERDDDKAPTTTAKADEVYDQEKEQT